MRSRTVILAALLTIAPLAAKTEGHRAERGRGRLRRAFRLVLLRRERARPAQPDHRGRLARVGGAAAPGRAVEGPKNQQKRWAEASPHRGARLPRHDHPSLPRQSDSGLPHQLDGIEAIVGPQADFRSIDGGFLALQTLHGPLASPVKFLAWNVKQEPGQELHLRGSGHSRWAMCLAAAKARTLRRFAMRCMMKKAASSIPTRPSCYLNKPVTPARRKHQ